MYRYFSKLNQTIRKYLSFALSIDSIILRKMIKSGNMVVIPVGFRCFAKDKIKESLGISFGKTYPFDNGFFPPVSVANVLRRKKINLTNSQSNQKHTVCLKRENYYDSVYGHGIKFTKSTYHFINSTVTNTELKNLNRYLDTSFGYYTLDIENNFVLAHYNWHKFADLEKSGGIYDPIINIQNINNTLNKRINRMFNACNKATHLIFIFVETQGYEYMIINDTHHDLKDLTIIENTVKELFSNKKKVIVKNLKDIKRLKIYCT